MCAGFHAQLQYENKKIMPQIRDPDLDPGSSDRLLEGPKRAWGPKKKKKIPGVIVVPSQMVLLFC